VETATAGWLYAWAWGIQAASEKKDAAWKFVSWASSKEYEELVGQEVGWSDVPAGKRASTYENPQYIAEASAFAEQTKNAIETADPLLKRTLEIVGQFWPQAVAFEDLVCQLEEGPGHERGSRQPRGEPDGRDDRQALGDPPDNLFVALEHRKILAGFALRAARIIPLADG